MNTELNEACARKLGWHQAALDGKSDGKYWFKPNYDLPNQLPNYAGSIEAAWEIVEKHPGLALNQLPNGKWFAALDSKNPEIADTAPLAIALCFLKLEDK